MIRIDLNDTDLILAALRHYEEHLREQGHHVEAGKVYSLGCHIGAGAHR